MILGVTCVRGGSKGLPRKNARHIAGKPMLAWTIEHAKKSKLLTDYVVCTEDAELINIALTYGAKVIERPQELSGDDVNRWDVVKYVIGKMPCSLVVLLQATSPVRPEGFVDECIKEFIDNEYDSLATGFWHHDSPYPENRGKNRQEMTPRFFDDGNVYIWRSDLIKYCPRQEAGLHPGLKVNKPLYRIDINDVYDFWLNERVLLENPFDCLR